MLPLSKLPKRQIYGFNDDRYCFDSIIYNKKEYLYPYYIYFNLTIIENDEDINMTKIENILNEIINNYCLDYVVEKVINYRYGSTKMIVKLGIHKNELSTVLDIIDELIFLSTDHEFVLSNKRLEGYFK